MNKIYRLTGFVAIFLVVFFLTSRVWAGPALQSGQATQPVNTPNLLLTAIGLNGPLLMTPHDAIPPLIPRFYTPTALSGQSQPIATQSAPLRIATQPARQIIPLQGQAQAAPTTQPVSPVGLSAEQVLQSLQDILQAKPASENNCSKNGAWNILILGSDYKEMRGQKGSDLTRMLRMDFTNKRIVVFALSRNLWVDTAGIGLSNPEINAAPLGMVYYQGRIRSPNFAEIDTVVDGTRATARMLSKNFSLNTDHYLTVDLDHLAEMIDSVGGLSINIPARITDPWIGMVINPGQQVLNGTQVVAYVRAIPDTDFDRINRNDVLLDALRQKLLEPAVMGKIPELYNRFKAVVATDLSLEQINHLACLLKEVPANSIIKESVRREWTNPGPQGSLVWDQNNVLTLLKGLGLIP